MTILKKNIIPINKTSQGANKDMDIYEIANIIRKSAPYDCTPEETKNIVAIMISNFQAEVQNKNLDHSKLKDFLKNKIDLIPLDSPSLLYSVASSAIDFGLYEDAQNLFEIAKKIAPDHPSEYTSECMYQMFTSPEQCIGACIVNETPIIRDGLLNEKDWLAAVAQYEEAGHYGLGVGYFNAANVLSWYLDEHGEDFGLQCRLIANAVSAFRILEVEKTAIDFSGENTHLTKRSLGLFNKIVYNFDYSNTRLKSILSEYPMCLKILTI